MVAVHPILRVRLVGAGVENGVKHRMPFDNTLRPELPTAHVMCVPVDSPGAAMSVARASPAPHHQWQGRIEYEAFRRDGAVRFTHKNNRAGLQRPYRAGAAHSGEGIRDAAHWDGVIGVKVVVTSANNCAPTDLDGKPRSFFRQ